MQVRKREETEKYSSGQAEHRKARIKLERGTHQLVEPILIVLRSQSGDKSHQRGTKAHINDPHIAGKLQHKSPNSVGTVAQLMNDKGGHEKANEQVRRQTEPITEHTAGDPGCCDRR